MTAHQCGYEKDFETGLLYIRVLKLKEQAMRNANSITEVYYSPKIKVLNKTSTIPKTTHAHVCMYVCLQMKVKFQITLFHFNGSTTEGPICR